MNRITLVVVFFSLQVQICNSQCLDGWTESDIDSSACLRVFTQPMNWVDAENYCANFTYKIVFENTGNLVSVWSAFLNNDFGGVAKNLTMGNMAEWWIGLSTNHFGNFGTWMWSDGYPFSYSNFAKGQTCNKGDNNCCVTATLPNFQWNIRNCNGSSYPFMCQLVGP